MSQDMTRKFMWRDTQHNFHRPQDMETRHLFMTLRMIWNHTAPYEYRIEPYRRYSFGPFYSTEYMQQAVISLSAELATREDLEPYWQKCLNHMVTCLAMMREGKIER